MNPHIAKVATQREIGLRGSLHQFVRMAWHQVEPGPFCDNWSIGAVAEHLEAVHAGQIKRLIINIPPGCMKSLEVSVFWPTWCWLRDASTRWMFASFDADLTRRDNGKALRLMQSPWFQERWGNRVVLRAKDPAVGNYENTAGGFRFATSVEGKSTGRHPDYQVIDDPLKPKAISKTTLEGAQEWLRGTMSTRWRDIATGRRVIIMQRLHEDDLAGYCIAEGGYDLLRLPMRYEAANPCVTVLGNVDPRTEEGELLWPERFPEDAVHILETKEMTPAGAAAQLQQRPAPAGGLIFQKGWFGYWVKPGAPTDHLPLGRWKVLPERFDLQVQSWDMTFKETNTSDFVVGQLWARKSADLFLIDQVRDRMDLPKTLDAVKAFTKLHPRALAKLIEDKANGPAVIASLRSEIQGLIAVNPQGGKVARANAAAPVYASGNVYVPDPRENRWVAYFIGEHTSFPFAKNDDCVDTATQAITYMSNGYLSFLEAMRVEAARGVGR